MNTITDRLKSIRKHLGLSQKDFSAALGCGVTTFSNYARGKRNLPIELLVKITNLGIDGNWLLIGEGEMLREATPFAQTKTSIHKEQEVLLRLLGLAGDIDQIIKAIVDKPFDGGAE